MDLTYWQEIQLGAHQAFRTFVPHERDRVPITWQNGFLPILCYTPFIFMAYLARRPDTYLIRLLLLPSVIALTLAAAYRFTWTKPELNVYNWGQCLFAAVVIAKTLEFAFIPEGMLKLGESRPGVVKGKGKDQNNSNKSTINGHADLNSDAPHPFIASWLSDAFELAHSLRGLRWKFGQGVYIPRETRPIYPPSAFLRATAITFIKHYLALDLIESCLKLFPGSISTPFGGSIFYSSLPPFQRYAVATLIHTLTGTAILEGFGMVYDLVTLIAVGLFRSHPTSWPPIIDAPWSATSMHDLWARRWHQLLRRTFLVFGGYPGRFLTFGSDIGLVCGAFIASGLFHECAMYAMRRGYDHSATIFFAMQGPVLIGERLWRKVTGRRVGGWAGRLWVYFMMLIVAQPMVDAWHRRGLAGGRVIPPTLSPARQILFPFILKLWQFLSAASRT